MDNRPLHYDYQYQLASMLLTKLNAANFELAMELHSSSDFKFYTFSGLHGGLRPGPGGLEFQEAWFILSSPDSKFIRSFSEGLLDDPEFNLGRGKFGVSNIEILPRKEITKQEHFRTLSPIYLKTMREREGKLSSWDLYPKDGKFYENLHTNLVKRFESYYARSPGQDYFEVIQVTNVKAKRIRVRDNMRRCSLFSFEVQGSPELLEFGYQAGFGEKNAMGFGCVEVVERMGADLRG